MRTHKLFYSKAVFFVFALFALKQTISAQNTYTWIATGSQNWQTATNWSPSRITPAADDILLFNTGGTVTARFTPAVETIGQLKVSNNTHLQIALPLLAEATNNLHTLTIAGLAGDDFTVAAGSRVSFLKIADLTLASIMTDYGRFIMPTGVTANIEGILSFETSRYQFDIADEEAMIFQAGSICQLANGWSGYGNGSFGSEGPENCFGTTGTEHVALIKDNASLIISNFFGRAPWGLPRGHSKIAFDPNSNYIHQAGALSWQDDLDHGPYGNVSITSSDAIHTGGRFFNSYTDAPVIINGNLTLSVFFSESSLYLKTGLVLKGNLSIDLSGGLSVSTNNTGSSAAEFEFAGNNTQLINRNNGGGIQFSENITVVINNPAGVMLTPNINPFCFATNNVSCDQVFVKGVLNLADGILKLQNTADTIIVGPTAVVYANPNSFVDGKVKKLGGYPFEFPLGKTGAGYAPIAIYSPNNTNDITAEYIHSNPQLISTNYTPGLNHVSQSGYWKLGSTFAGSTGWLPDITGFWKPQISGNGSSTYINNLASLKLAHYSSTLNMWDRFGGVIDPTSTNAVGSITIPGQPDFLDIWALASTDNNNPLGNISGPLPITVNYLTGSKQSSNSNLIGWQAACSNTTGATFSLQRGSKPNNVTEITSITATAARCLQPFSYTDITAANGINYYRLKVTEANGKISYSNVIAIINAADGFEVVNIYPTVATEQATVNMSAAQKTKSSITVSSANGKLMQQHEVTIPAGSSLYKLNTSALPAGVYFVRIVPEKGEAKTVRFIKQ